MARWQPDARGRLEKAASELFAERGFATTTAADIAGRAGVTERTFFRHYADKREVLFAGAVDLQELMVGAVRSAPAMSSAMEAVRAGVYASAEIFEGRRELSARRQQLIAAHAELQERELIKLASLAGALAEALRAREVPDPAAGLAAEAGVVVFRMGFERWVTDPRESTLRAVMTELFAALAQVTA